MKTSHHVKTIQMPRTAAYYPPTYTTWGDVGCSVPSTCLWKVVTTFTACVLASAEGTFSLLPCNVHTELSDSVTPVHATWWTGRFKSHHFAFHFTKRWVYIQEWTVITCRLLRLAHLMGGVRWVSVEMNSEKNLPHCRSFYHAFWYDQASACRLSQD